jgi:peptidoglycan pentaglycine glycine transferase (the first glycine)
MTPPGNKSQAQCLFSHEAKNELCFDYEVSISENSEDSAWDTFVEHAAGGCYKQASLWAKMRAQTGWHAIRMCLWQDGQIKAGAQVLFRPISFFGNVGEVVQGPICSSENPQTIDLVLDELVKVAKKYHIRLLHVQPPYKPYNAIIDACLISRTEYSPSFAKGLVASTLVIDLSQNLDDILQQMDKNRRYRIRYSQRKGVTGREGTETDLDTFYRLLAATGERQGFTPEPKEYYDRLWQTLAPYDSIKLFIVEYLGEALSAALYITFGDTVIRKRSAWSGQHGELSPNEALRWAAITWAKSRGYRYYDFDGIDSLAAKAILNGEPVPEICRQNVTYFKIAFGGKPILYPEAYDLITNPVLRFAYGTVFPKVGRSPTFLKLLMYLRTH